MITDAFANCGGTGVSHGKTLGGDPGEEGLASRASIKCCIARDDSIVRGIRGLVRFVHHQGSATEALADVVVGVALELESDTRSQEVAKGLSGAADERHANGSLGESC